MSTPANEPTVINALLDAAKTATGSDYKTAKLLGTTPQMLSDWRHGHKNAQPEDHALIAGVAGLDPEEALVRAVIAKHADKPKGERLMSVLGNVLRRTGAAVTLGFFASVGWVTTPQSASASPSIESTMCRLFRRQRRECQMIPT